MTKWLFLCASAMGVAVACTSGSPESEANKAPSAPASPSAPVEMQRASISSLYDSNCASCHGADGSGGGAGTKSFLTEELFDQSKDKDFFDKIKNGVPAMGMEGFAESLTDAQIWGLVVNIREKQARALRRKNGSPKAVNGVYSSKHHSYKIETVVDESQGLRVPWAIEWLTDGTALVANRPGGITVIKNGTAAGEVEGLPPVTEIGQGGMMEIAVHPKYRENGWIYLGFTDPAQSGSRSGFTKIVRGKLAVQGSSYRWTGTQTIWQTTQDNYNGSGLHYGVRIVFDGKGFIYFGIGERGNAPLAQDLSKPNGKVYRVREDGSVPQDNPFVNTPNAIPSIWSYGHRNPQGLVLDQRGDLWDTEHGPRGGDELNRVKKGANYGWPLVSFSINYNDQPLTTPWPTPDQKITLPVYRWLPSIGACGLDMVTGSAFPKWKGDLVAGGLSGANVDRIRVQGDKLIEREEILHGMGRVRDVRTGPDGRIYVVLNQPDKIVRITP